MLEGSQSGGYGQPERIWVRVLGRVGVIRVGRVVRVVVRVIFFLLLP